MNAEFRLCVGHDCLGTHLHRTGIRPDPYCMLCSIREPVDRNHLGQCTALLNRTECERYWEARIKMMENWLCFFLLLLFLWLLLTFRIFIFALNVFSIYTVIVTFYFYWSHWSMMNNQWTCHQGKKIILCWCLNDHVAPFQVKAEIKQNLYMPEQTLMFPGG